MSYITAGYASALSVLFAYGVMLAVRRRRLQTAVAGSGEDGGAESPAAPR